MEVLISNQDGFGIVNYNPKRTYCPLVPKQYTLRATKGSPQIEVYMYAYYGGVYRMVNRFGSIGRRINNVFDACISVCQWPIIQYSW